MDTFDYVQVRKDQLIWLIAILIVVFLLFWSAVCLLAVVFNHLRMLSLAREKESRLAESERTTRHISDALHDDLQNQLSLACRMISDKIKLVRNGAVISAEKLVVVRNAVLEALDHLRDVSLLLEGKHRIRSLGFCGAVRQMVDFYNQPASTDISCKLDCEVDEDITEEVTLHLYRIIQEALGNAVKHANAQRITVTLRQGDEGKTVLAIYDNGWGFKTGKTTDDSSRGLEIMRFRSEAIGASLSIDSVPGNGTLIHLSF